MTVDCTRDGSTLTVAGVGNEHAVWRYEGADSRLIGSVLRLRRHREPALTAAESPLVRLLGAGLVPRPCPVRLDASVADALCASVGHAITPPQAAIAATVTAMREALDAPATAAVAGPSADGAASGWLEPDATRLHTARGGAARRLCVELKPKCGILPAATGPLAAFAPGRCRFCLYADLKARRRAGAAAATAEPPQASPSGAAPAADGARRYCPLDLYSHDGALMREALSSLLASPRNNLRVRSEDGALVFGGEAGVDRAGLRAELRRVVHSGSAGATQCGAAATSEEEAVEAELVSVLASVLQQEPVLRRLRAVQARAACLSSACALALYERGLQLAGGGDELRALVASRAQSCSCGGACGGARDGRAPPCESPGWPLPPHFDSRRGAADACECSLDACVSSLADWLLSLTAADVSVMVTFARQLPAETEAAADEQLAGGQLTAAELGGGVAPTPAEQPRGTLSPGTVFTARGDAYWYRVTVVDVQLKPLSKVAEHAALDERIVCDDGRLPGRVCDPNARGAMRARAALLERAMGDT